MLCLYAMCVLSITAKDIANFIVLLDNEQYQIFIVYLLMHF